MKEMWGILRTKRAGLIVLLACAALTLFWVTGLSHSDTDKSAKGVVPSSSASETEDPAPLPTVASDGDAKFVSDEKSPQTAQTVDWVSTHERVQRHEALPCTGPKDPINFETFTAGPSVAGVPLTGYTRRCDAFTLADESPANFTNYIYGDCETSGGDGGCEPPLQIQTWPACQRTLSDYTFEGKPMPYRRLPSLGDAEVVEIEFMFGPRIEVYTATSTIVLFAQDLALAIEALDQLRSQGIGQPPATKADELSGPPDDGLVPPNDGATEGELSC
jgi:hypothetical protein